jgi:hypothetical protein
MIKKVISTNEKGYISHWAIIRGLGILLVASLLSACNMPTGGTSSSLESTKAVLDVQATIQDQQSQQEVQATSLSADATRIAQEVQATVIAQQAAQLTQQALQLDQEPNTQPTMEETASNNEQQNMSSEIDVDYKTMMKSANILLFEDMAGLYEVRYIKNALDMMGLPYVDVGDASGNFKEQILSGTDWDLIIVGAESRNKIQGEFFVYLNEQLNNGTAVILEIWSLDEIGAGKVSSILTRCGIKFQEDWWEPESPSLWYLAPDHSVFHEPNEGMSLKRFVNYWWGDVGDLIALIPGGNATLLVGNIATEKQRYGTVATCLDGRLIIQTHSTHNYRQEDMERLWQNYIYNTLKSHFETTQ